MGESTVSLALKKKGAGWLAKEMLTREQRKGQPTRLTWKTINSTQLT
jgi:hypothetical protein